MKISFNPQGMNIASKKFNPFNFSIYGIEVKAEEAGVQKDPLNMLENLMAVRKPAEGATVADRVKALQSMANR